MERYSSNRGEQKEKKRLSEGGDGGGGVGGGGGSSRLITVAGLVAVATAGTRDARLLGDRRDAMTSAV